MAVLRTSSLALGLAALLGVPVAVLLLDLGPQAALPRLASGLGSALDQVGWVLPLELALAVGVVGLAIERVLGSIGGLAAAGSPGWLEPAIESALLLGMLGTLSGMVSGFAGLRGDELTPAPLLHALGRALRSSLLGFSIALVGVWARHQRTGVAT